MFTHLLAMLNFFKIGKTLNGIEIGTTLSNLITALGEPTEIVGDHQNGYVYYEYYRYGYTKNIITELSIEFPLIETPILLQDVEYKKYDISLFEDFSLDQDTQLHELIRLLNHLQLDWTSKNEIDKDHVIIRLDNGLNIVGDLSEGFIVRISIMNGFKN
ncbi:hypothetical protein [Aquimarina brevivitae]|uniref:Uncharacterized protein n=1 Tax=Aquimarina brevivitae TaxID=323412 RepID=A0A4Q7P383_9FLAO|nr:hypothetical protein [Aquimarina brevivitae]RZS93860.1 hypothetical protein EV197_2441 [Aquimarina brevivitae]